MEIKITIDATGLERALTLLAESIGYAIIVQDKKSGCKCEPKISTEPIPATDQQQGIGGQAPDWGNAAPVLNGLVPPAVPQVTQPIPQVAQPVPQTAQPTPQAVQYAPTPVQQSIPMPAPVVPTTTAPSFTIDQLAVAATQLMDAGQQPALLGLLGQFGVNALTALPKEQYGSFATALRQLGAKI